MLFNFLNLKINNEIDVNLAFADNALGSASTAQVDDMEDLALQCPYVEGTAVYEAVAFMEFEGLTTDSINYCASEAETAELREYVHKEKASIEAEVFPNPANSHIFINVDHGNPGKFFLYNSIGQIVKQGVFRSNDRISLTDINTSGVYYLHLVEEEGNSETIPVYIEQ